MIENASFTFKEERHSLEAAHFAPAIYQLLQYTDIIYFMKYRDSLKNILDFRFIRLIVLIQVITGCMFVVRLYQCQSIMSLETNSVKLGLVLAVYYRANQHIPPYIPTESYGSA